MILVWAGVSILTFIIANVVPRDPVALRLGPKATAASIENLKKQLGMDRPLPEQYLHYMTDLFKGDLGTSVMTGRPIIKDLGDYFPATVELSLAAIGVTIVLGIPLGVLAANKKGSVLDHTIQFLATFGLAVPLFWLGLIFQLLFYRQLNILPLDSRIDAVLGPPERIFGMYILDSLLRGDWTRLGNALVHLILPTATMCFFTVGGLARMVRASTIETLGTDYIRAARAKGVAGTRLLFRHVLRNSLLPAVTVLGNTVNALLAGAFVVETIFNWSGLGWYATKAILSADYFVVVSVTLIIAVICTTVNLLVDLAYHTLDPRIQLN
jgi:peptide/nickel transport system permease protein